MPITDISSWNQKPWFNTGGTRDKVFVESPDGRFHYFKTSLYKPESEGKREKYYKYEFWNEIIAYQLGKELGVDVLPYKVAYTENYIGCISESMIKEEESLVEGIRYLQAYAPDFNPGNRKEHYKYSFQLILASLRKYNLERFIKNIVEVIVFDSVIGNGDRHQENWATINEIQYKIHYDSPNVDSEKRTFRFGNIFKAKTTELGTILQITEEAKLDSPQRFAPIYDNGSCLCRELTETKVSSMLANPAQLESYINRGPSEIHWFGQKISHFELVRNLLDTEYRDIVKETVARFQERFDLEIITKLVTNVDKHVPIMFSSHIIPDERKRLIINVIHLRYQKLVDLMS
jgi:hypothetical protein